MKRRLAFFLPSSLSLLFPFISLSSLLQAISSFISFLLTWCTSSSCSIVSFWAFHHLISPPPVFLHSYSIFLPSFCLTHPVCDRAPSSFASDYSTFPSPTSISLYSLLILLFPAFTPLLLSAIIRFSPVFLSKYCHLALPQSFYWGSRWRPGVCTSLYVPAVSSCQLKVQGINIPTLQAFQTNLLPKKKS